MFADYFQVHADVLRNAFVLLIFAAGMYFVGSLVTAWLYRRKAYREASEYLKRRNVELTIRCQELEKVKAEQWREIERLTRVQNAAVGAANTVQEIVREDA